MSLIERLREERRIRREEAQEWGRENGLQWANESASLFEFECLRDGHGLTQDTKTEWLLFEADQELNGYEEEAEEAFIEAALAVFENVRDEVYA